MERNQIQDEKENLRRIVEYLNKITAQPVDGFYIESIKIRYLHKGVLGKKLATTSLKNIFTSQCTFERFFIALNDSIQLEREIEKAGSLSPKHAMIIS